VTILQFVEGLPNCQAAEAVRSRLDWTYLLGLDLTDPGLDFSVLSEFRVWLVAGSAAERLLTVFLDQCQARGWLKARDRQWTDSTHVLAAVRARCTRAKIGPRQLMVWPQAEHEALQAACQRETTESFQQMYAKYSQA
jgi:hypothetical protein